MNDGVPERARPRWVKLILWGLTTRVSAWVSAWLCLALATGSVGYAVMVSDRRSLIGGIMLLGTIGYVLAIRWVDRHGDWG